MEGLGRVFNAIPAASGVYINMRDHDAVSWLANLATTTDPYTIVEAQDAAGTGAQNLVKVGQYYTSGSAGGSAWAKQTQAAAATVVKTSAAAQNAACFTVGNTQLSDGYKFVKCTASGASTVAAITHDLKTMRSPENLPALGV